MTPTQIKQVQTSWMQVLPQMDMLATLFYCRLFELDPNLKPLFKADISIQADKLVAMLDTVVRSLSNPEKILPAVKSLGRRHASYQVKPQHYNVVAEALLWTLQQGLGEDFTEEVQKAWTDAYMLLASTMQQAAEEIQQPAVA